MLAQGEAIWTAVDIRHDKAASQVWKYLQKSSKRTAVA